MPQRFPHSSGLLIFTLLEQSSWRYRRQISFVGDCSLPSLLLNLKLFFSPIFFCLPLQTKQKLNLNIHLRWRFYKFIFNFKNILKVTQCMNMWRCFQMEIFTAIKFFIGVLFHSVFFTGIFMCYFRQNTHLKKKILLFPFSIFLCKIYLCNVTVELYTRDVVRDIFNFICSFSLK